MSNSRIFSKLPSDLANNVGKVATVISGNTIGWVTANIEPAFSQANSAASNTIYTFGVDIAQNTRLSTVESNTVYLFGASTQTNNNIISANTQLKSYTDGLISYIATINNTQNTNITTTTDLAQGAYNTANLKFNTSGGNITGPVIISSNLTITGNLTVAGNVTTVSANNLILKDNLIYLNDGNTIANPDLGIAGNYNDGIYRHTGFFRDASDGYWKVFDNYLPEPDASPYIDTSNSSFRIADFQANNVTLGKITTSSSLLVTNLNSQYLNGQTGSYYTTASNLTGSIPSAVLGANTLYVGTTAIALNRASASQSLTGVSIDGSAGTATTATNLSGGSISGSTGGYFGGTTYTKNATATSSGNISFDNGTTDTPGIHFYYGNSTNFGIDVASSVLRFVNNLDETAGSVKAALDTSGNFVAGGNITAYGSPSDIRLKNNIVKLENCLEIVKCINGYSFNYNGDENRMVGVLAQEVEKVLPEVIYEFQNLEQETYKAVRYENMVAILIEAMKEQQVQIESLKTRLDQVLSNDIKF